MGDFRRWRQAIDRLATRQWGHVRRAQLFGAGDTGYDDRLSRAPRHHDSPFPDTDSRRHDTQLGIRTVTLLRAIRDIWPNLTPRQRIRVPNDARLRHLISADQAACLLGHRRNPTRSGNEDELQHIVDRFDLPRYEPNVWVCGGEADAWHRDGRVVIEVDDPATHEDALHRADDAASTQGARG